MPILQGKAAAKNSDNFVTVSKSHCGNALTNLAKAVETVFIITMG
jgi:hypothetical protein